MPGQQYMGFPEAGPSYPSMHTYHNQPASYHGGPPMPLPHVAPTYGNHGQPGVHLAPSPAPSAYSSTSVLRPDRPRGFAPPPTQVATTSGNARPSTSSASSDCCTKCCCIVM